MNVQTLIQKLEKFKPDTEVMIHEDVPRTINYGPRSYQIREYDVEQCADCEGKLDETVVIIGFGNY